MAEVVSLSNASLQEAVRKIGVKFSQAIDLNGQANRARITAGRMLIDLRERIDAGEAGKVRWWDWWKTHCICSRREAERCMKMAESPDPAAALADERELARDSMRRSRAALHATNVGRKNNEPEQDIIEEALQIVASMTDQQRRTFFVRLEEDYQW